MTGLTNTRNHRRLRGISFLEEVKETLDILTREVRLVKSAISHMGNPTCDLGDLPPPAPPPIVYHRAELLRYQSPVRTTRSEMLISTVPLQKALRDNVNSDTDFGGCDDCKTTIPICLESLLDPPNVGKVDDRDMIVRELQVALLNSQGVIDAQNDSIAFLCSQLDAVREPAFDIVMRRLKDIETKVEAYSGSWSTNSSIGTRTKKQNSKNDIVTKARSACDLHAVSEENDGVSNDLHAQGCDTNAVDTAVSFDDKVDENCADSELAKSKQLIAELRAQAAARSAIAARHADLTKNGRVIQTVHVPASSDDQNYRIGDLFTTHAGAADSALLSEPYLVSAWQLANLEELLTALVAKTHVHKLALSTHTRSQCNADALTRVADQFENLGLHVSVAFVCDLHNRELAFNNSVVVTSDRGLDIFKPPLAEGRRPCRNTTIVIYEQSVGSVTRSFNVAADVAREARNLLTNEVTCDLLKVESLLKETKTNEEYQKTQTNETKKVKLALEGSKVKQLVKDAGLRFTSACTSVAKRDGYSCPAAYFAANFDIYNERTVANGLKEFVSYKWLENIRPLADDYFAHDFYHDSH